MSKGTASSSKLATSETESAFPKWRHAGGKLVELGADKLSDAELLAIIIGSGIQGRPVQKPVEISGTEGAQTLWDMHDDIVGN